MMIIVIMKADDNVGTIKNMPSQVMTMSEEDNNVKATVEKNVGETTIKNLPRPPPSAQSIHTRGAEKKEW